MPASTIRCGRTLAILILLSPIASQAAERSWNAYGWADMGSTTLDYHYENNSSEPHHQDNEQPAFGAGLRWNSGLHIEAGHVQKLLDWTVESSFYSGDVVSRRSLTTTINATFLAFGWSWKLGNTPLSATVLGGVARFSVDGPDVEYCTCDYANHDLTYGIRLDYALSERWQVGLGVQRFALGDLEMDRSALRLSYHF